jgi:hypothetical protein
MCSIKATKARSHPLQLRQGLIWVWPEAGAEAAAEAAATPPTVATELEDPRYGQLPFPSLCDFILLLSTVIADVPGSSNPAPVSDFTWQVLAHGV